MHQPISGELDMSASAERRIRKLTVRDYYLLAREGHLDPSERTELVDGEIISMFPIGFSHSDVQAKLLTQLYPQQDLRRFRIWPGGLRISDTGERYPDVSVIRPGVTNQPSASDLLLLIEIADTSLTYDLTEKRNEYETAGVPEYWVVDVTDKTIFVFEMEQGRYRSLGAKSAGVLPLRAFPDVTITIADLF
jgi:Uma2 family endonuclease